jgi:hypothetical protein
LSGCFLFDGSPGEFAIFGSRFRALAEFVENCWTFQSAQLSAGQ